MANRTPSHRALAALSAAALLVACGGGGADGRTCGPGTVAQGGACVAPDPAAACAAGTHFTAGACVADAGPDAFCGAGTVVAAGRCVAIADPSARCGPGTRPSGAVCIPDGDPSASCGPGTVAADGVCVADADGARFCGAGTILAGGLCAPALAPAEYCGPGTELAGSQCFPSAAPASSCGPGTVLADGLCVPSTPPEAHCGAGARLRPEDQRCIPTLDPSTLCGPGTAFEGGACVDARPAAAWCGPGTALTGGLCLPTTAPADWCGPGTTFDGALCRPAAAPAAHCGPGTVLASAGDQCVPASPPADHCGEGTHLSGGVCVPAEDASRWCGPGTYAEGTSCHATGANGWRVLVPTTLPAEHAWRVPVRVMGPPGAPPEVVVLVPTRDGAVTLDPPTVMVGGAGGTTWAVGCEATAPGCVGPVRLAAHRAVDGALLTMSDPIALVAPQGVGTPAACQSSPNALLLDGISWVWSGVALITDAEFTPLEVAPDHLQLRVYPADAWTTGEVFLDLSSRRLGAPLAPGVYEGGGGYPFEPAGRPGLTVSTSGRGCTNPSDGRFQIQRIDVGAGVLRELLATLELHCATDAGILRACVHYTAPPPAPVTP